MIPSRFLIWQKNPKSKEKGRGGGRRLSGGRIRSEISSTRWKITTAACSGWLERVVPLLQICQRLASVLRPLKRRKCHLPCAVRVLDSTMAVRGPFLDWSRIQICSAACRGLSSVRQKLGAICERIPAFTACVRVVNFFYSRKQSIVFHADGNRYSEWRRLAKD